MKLLLSIILTVLNPVFAHIGVEEGLSQTTVFSIAQDADGEMWFATYDGLDRFNGYDINVYRHSEDSTSISGNNISRLFIDSENRLWVASDNGVDVFDKASDTFSHILSTRALVVSDFVELDNHVVLAGSNKGTYVFEQETDGSFDCRYSKIAQRRSAVFELMRGSLLVGGLSAGITVVDLKDGVETSIPFLGVCGNVNDISWIGSRLWISTNADGLYSVESSLNGEVMHYLHGKGNSICSDHVRAVCADGEGNLWIATGNNISVLDTLSGVFSTISPTRYSTGSLSHCSIKSILHSSEGGMWLGSYYGGVNYYHPARNFFKRVELSGVPIISGGISICKDGSMWIGSNRHGLFHYWPQSREVRHLSLSDDPEKDDIKGITISSDGNKMYVSSAQGGLFICATSNGRVLSHYDAARAVYDSYEDENGLVWVCSMGGLFCLNQKQGTFRKVDFSELNTLPAFRIIKSKDGWYWIGAVNVFLKCHLFLNENGHADYSDLIIYDNLSFVQDIYESSTGIIWLATRSGFYSIDRDILLRQDLPVSSNIYCGIEEDTHGRLWVTTENGLVCHTPQTGTSRVFTIKDGMPSNTFNTYGHAMADDGTLYVGGFAGVFSLDSRTVSPERSGILPEITVVHAMDRGNPRVDKKGRVVLKHSQNTFDIHFNVIDYISWQQGCFRYKLEGYDNEWSMSSQNRATSYSKVRSGNYTFALSYSPAGADNFSSVVSLPIVIRPAWYLSIPALVAWALLLFIAVFFLVFSFVNLERNRNLEEINRLSELSARTEREVLCMRYANNSSLSDGNYDFLKRAYDCVMDNLSNENFAVEELARALGLTRTRVYVRLKEITGDSALNFIRGIRLNEACRLLEEGELPMAEIAVKVGFRTPAYFSTCFKSQLGMTPKQYLSSKRD